MKDRIGSIADSTIKYSFYTLFFLVPLILTPFNYELFEYNKMMLTYGIATLIMTAWGVKMIARRQIAIPRTPLTIPLAIFFLSQVISTVFSIDPHVSLFGYYSRFNGGLFSTIAYILLYFAFVANFPRNKIMRLLHVSLSGAVLVAFYGILEHMGIDKNIWVQDVQNRVFSTLGQPNWLAAYLAILIPVAIGMSMNFQFSIFNFQSNHNVQKSKVQKKSSFSIGLLIYWFIGVTFYATLLFTKSRSGFLGFWIAEIVFLFLIFKFKKELVKSFIILNSLFLILTFLFGAPIQQINRYTLQELFKGKQLTSNNQPASSAGGQPTTNYGGSLIDVGITESGVIRSIVWKGALDIFKSNPIIGTGVETFAFSYYRQRPVEHNMTSEWDFLYNKAHNEYLNFAANSGILGLGSHLLFIGVFAWWVFHHLKTKNQNPKSTSQNLKSEKEQTYNSDLGFNILVLGLFCGWLTILVTNFFGFSVVAVQLFFYLIPAICFVLTHDVHILRAPLQSENEKVVTTKTLAITDYTLIIIFLFFSLYVFMTLGRFWIADVLFANGYHANRSSDFSASYDSTRRAILLNDKEPLYYDEFSYPTAQLAVTFASDGQSTIAAQLTTEAILASDKAVHLSPQNVNFWKTRTRVFYTLYQIDENYLSDSKDALEKALELSPTDPKIYYNLALLNDKFNKKDEAIRLLEKAAALKADYRDAYFALGLFYQRDKKTDEAKKAFNYIIERINPQDADALKQLRDIK